ncbi:MAG: enoyl-CoA hydratase [Rhodobacteraceae bacterium]|nr:enoyl-CoA hydratase [Paracoccaceae bacterium]
MTQSLLHRETLDGIAIVTLASPENLNALSNAMIAALHAEFDRIADDRSVRVVVLRAVGKAFCAGHDLREMTTARQSEDGGAAAFDDLFGRCSAMMQAILALPQPVIAQVHGIATAAGCQLVASCDMAVAAETCRFGVNGVNIGLFCSTPMVALTRNVPRKKAFELLSTGRFVGAAEAEDLGLVNRVVPDAELEAATMDLARMVAAKLSVAVRIGKRAFYDQAELPLAAAYDMTRAAIVQNMLHPDTEEGICAFLEKRPPAWQD